VKSNGGLEPLVELIKDHANHENKELMAAVTGTDVNGKQKLSFFF